MSFCIVEHSFDFTASGAGECDALAGIVYEDLKTKPSLVIVDTLARNMGGDDENSTQDKNKFIGTPDWLRNEFKTTVLVVHHPGKDPKNLIRGAGALGGALDTLIVIKPENDGDACQVAMEMQKDSEVLPVYVLDKVEIDLGRDHHAENRLTCGKST